MTTRRTDGEHHRWARDKLIRTLERRGIRDRRVLDALRAVPRHLFIPSEQFKQQAYEDYALPIGAEQTISQPWVVARMTELLGVDSEHSVLEIGTGSGYQCAVLAQLARRVYSLERIGALARKAIERIRSLGLTNVKIQIFDGTVGWSDVAPFDRVMITAAAPSVPKPLLDQLATPGRLVVPEGERHEQRLVTYIKNEQGAVGRHVGEAVTFVPLIGRHGWSAKTSGR
ncbi:MAG: protein-L-isoaspartate(D-aspartate) O-methyltransferase [Acidobacteriota bacterium]